MTKIDIKKADKKQFIIKGISHDRVSIVKTAQPIVARKQKTYFEIKGMGGLQGATGGAGPQGPQGDAATVTIGTVTTGAPGTNAIVTNSGTTSEAVFNFTIPRGDTGASGSGTGDMVASEYDPTNTVKDKGGIPAYVSDAIASDSPVKSVNGQTGNVVIDSASEWGNISGTLSNQTDLQSALDAKQNTISDLDSIRSGAALGATALQSISDSSITTPKLASSAVTTDKIADGAVTRNKLDPDATGMVYLGSVTLTAKASELLFTAPDTYKSYKILVDATIATGSDTWVEVRMLNGTSNILNTHQVQSVGNDTWSCAVNARVNYLINLTNVNRYDGIDADVSVFGAGTGWKKFNAYLGKAQGSNIATRISNGRNDIGTVPNVFQLITGGTFTIGSWIKVWGWN